MVEITSRVNRESLLAFHFDFCNETRALVSSPHNQIIPAQRKAEIGVMSVEAKLLDHLEEAFFSLVQVMNRTATAELDRDDFVEDFNPAIEALINQTVIFYAYVKESAAMLGVPPIRMTLEQVQKHHDDLCSRGREIMKAKNHDYAGGRSGNKPFANFTRTKTFDIASAEVGFLVRMSDKISRLVTFTEGNKLQVKDESILDSCIDLVNYSILLLAYLWDCYLINRTPIVN